MSFVPFALLAYIFLGAVAIIDKILLKTSIPNPLVYTFYISIFGLLSLLLLPFGFKFTVDMLVFGTVSGISSTFALLTYFKSLKAGAVSIVSPVIGTLNPLFALILGLLFLNQIITKNQIIAFSVLILGAGILTFSLWVSKIKFNTQLKLMIVSGFLFALSYITLREVFLLSDFYSGIILTRIVAAITAISFLFLPQVRKQIFKPSFSSGILFLAGQTMGAFQGLLLAYATSLTSPALVNSLFGVQYIVILAAALILRKAHSKLLDERLTKATLLQKTAGAAILSLGVYLLSK